MKYAGLILAWATVATLELIQLVGASADPPRPAWFTPLTATMDLCLTLSSAILGPALFRRGRRWLGALFASNLAVMLVAFAVRSSGVEFPRPLLFGVGLYWLNLYLLGLPVAWRTLAERPPAGPGRPTP